MQALRLRIAIHSRVIRTTITLAFMMLNVQIELQAAEYPNRPLRFISGFAAGGGIDATARPIALKLSEIFNHPVIIDNRPGGGGNIASEITARAEPDGYTFLIIAPAFVINFGLHEKLPFELERDFIAVTQLVDSMNVLSIHPSVTANNVNELIALSKNKSLSFGSSGVGTVGHLAGELFNLMAGTHIVHIPYKGGGPVMIDLVGGQIQMVFASAGSVMPQIRSDKIKAIAVTSINRSPLMPNTPTLSESGLKGYEAKNWYGLIAPAKTPKSIINVINRQIVKILNLAEIKKVFSTQGLNSSPTTSEEFNLYIRSEKEKWKNVIKVSGTKNDGVF